MGSTASLSLLAHLLLHLLFWIHPPSLCQSISVIHPIRFPSIRPKSSQLV